MSSFLRVYENMVRLASSKVHLQFWTVPGWFPIWNAPQNVFPFERNPSLLSLGWPVALHSYHARIALHFPMHVLAQEHLDDR